VFIVIIVAIWDKRRGFSGFQARKNKKYRRSAFYSDCGDVFYYA